MGAGTIAETVTDNRDLSALKIKNQRNAKIQSPDLDL
jgi:hypothetical protein